MKDLEDIELSKYLEKILYISWPIILLVLFQAFLLIEKVIQMNKDEAIEVTTLKFNKNIINNKIYVYIKINE